MPSMWNKANEESVKGDSLGRCSTCTINISVIIHTSFQTNDIYLCLLDLPSYAHITFLCPTTHNPQLFCVSLSLSYLLHPSLFHPNVVSKQLRKLNHNYTPDIDLWSLLPPLCSPHSSSLCFILSPKFFFIFLTFHFLFNLLWETKTRLLRVAFLSLSCKATNLGAWRHVRIRIQEHGVAPMCIAMTTWQTYCGNNQ